MGRGCETLDKQESRRLYEDEKEQPELEDYDSTLTVKCWTAYDNNNRLTHIESAKRGHLYKCPECEQPMSAVKGEILAHHFRHKKSIGDEDIYCGGEGFKHLRVKLYLTQMLQEMAKQTYQLHNIRVQSEVKVEEDRPDIIITQNKDELLAIEIVDSHPPSKEKLERWNQRMKIINISKWQDVIFVDMAKLSAKLLPLIAEFSEFMANVVIEYSEHNAFKIKLLKERTEMEELIESEIAEKREILDKELIENYSKLRVNVPELRDYDNFPNLWPGSYRDIHRGKEKKKDFGVWIESENSEPSPGDFAICRSQNDDIWVNVLGELVREGEYKGNYWFLFRTSSKRIDNSLKEIIENI